jgi:hypothetical protein
MFAVFATLALWIYDLYLARIFNLDSSPIFNLLTCSLLICPHMQV